MSKLQDTHYYVFLMILVAHLCQLTGDNLIVYQKSKDLRSLKALGECFQENIEQLGLSVKSG